MPMLRSRFGPVPDSDILARSLGTALWRLVAAPGYVDKHGHPDRPGNLLRLHQVRFAAPAHINTLRCRGVPDPVILPASVTAADGEAVRQLVLGGLGVARFSDFMIDRDIAEGRVTELFPGQFDVPALRTSALYLVRSSGLRRLAEFRQWLEEITGAARVE